MENKGKINSKYIFFFALLIAILYAIFVIATGTGQNDINVQLLSPPDGYYDADGTVNLTCNATMVSGAVNTSFVNLSLLFNLTGGTWGLNQTNNTKGDFTNSTAYGFNITGLSDGVYTWACIAYHNASESDPNYNQSVNRTLTVDTTNPEVAINTPVSGSNSSSNTPLINITFYDATRGLVNTTINVTINASTGSGLAVYNITNMTCDNTITINDTANTTCTFTPTLPEGTVEINATAQDGLGFWQNSSRDFIVDTIGPAFSLNSTGGTGGTGLTVWIYSSWSETIGAKNASLYVNGEVNTTNTSVAYATYVNFTHIISRTAQSLDFNITVWDYLGNQNTTETMTVNVTDNTAPSLILHSPVSNANTTANVSFYFNVSDNFAGAINCTVNTNGVLNLTEENYTLTSANTVQQFNANISGFSDGAHYWNVSCWDDTGNLNKSSQQLNFTADSIQPTINLSTPENNSNMTSTGYLNITGIDSGTGLTSFTYHSTCNTTATSFTSDTLIQPFNNAGCTGSNGVITLTITATDYSNNQNISVFGFNVDDVGPNVFNITSPTDQQEFTDQNSQVNLSWSPISDAVSGVHRIGYYLDGKEPLTILGKLAAAEGNWSLRTLAAGTHTIKFWANDTVGNSANSSSITFIVNAQGDMEGFLNNLTLTMGGEHLSYLTLKLSDGTNISGDGNTSIWVNDTFDLEIITNSTGTDITVALENINGSAANWEKNFTIDSLASKKKSGIANNWTTNVTTLVIFNSTIDDFLPDTNQYFGRVIIPFNASNSSQITDVWWFIDEDNLYDNMTEVIECGSCGTTCGIPYLTSYTAPCYNVTSPTTSTIFLPHFSGVVASNDIEPPAVTIIAPTRGGNTVGSFMPNITVSSDAVNCSYYLNSSTTNTSMTLTGTMCLGTLTDFVNGTNYTITFYSWDEQGNLNNSESKIFYIDDIFSPGISSVKNTSITSASVAITWTTTEYANASVNYGTTINLGAKAKDITFDQKSQRVTIGDLSANTQYFYNVTSCDYNGNCNTSGHNNFTTLTVAAQETTSTGGRRGGGVSGPIVTEVNLENKPSFSTESGVTLEFAKGSEFKFKDNKQSEHTITISKIYDDSVLLTITSQATEITIEVGETKEIDVDNDGTIDIAVSLLGISYGRAELNFKKLAKVVTTPESQVSEEPVTQPVTEETGPSVSEEPIAEPVKKKYPYSTLIIIAIIVIIAVIVYLVLRPKDSKIF